MKKYLKQFAKSKTFDFLGVVVAKHHQRIAEEKMTQSSEVSDAIVKYLTENGRQKEIEKELKQFKVTRHIPDYVNIKDRGVINKDLAYLDGKELDDYLNDISIAQKYSTISRQTMLYRIADAMGWEIIDEFESMHNYIDIENGIIRKGATSAQAGERLIIPLNMRDGSIFATGKGNPECLNGTFQPLMEQDEFFQGVKLKNNYLLKTIVKQWKVSIPHLFVKLH